MSTGLEWFADLAAHEQAKSVTTREIDRALSFNPQIEEDIPPPTVEIISIERTE